MPTINKYQVVWTWSENPFKLYLNTNRYLFIHLLILKAQEASQGLKAHNVITNNSYEICKIKHEETKRQWTRTQFKADFGLRSTLSILILFTKMANLTQRGAIVPTDLDKEQRDQKSLEVYTIEDALKVIGNQIQLHNIKIAS